MSSVVDAVRAPRSLGPLNPFPGLRPYEEQDAEWFFGRGDEINDLLRRLRRVRFLAVVGPSGCGKSSLIKAGLLPAVQGYLDATWRILLFTPGDDPLRRLAETVSPLAARGQQDVLQTLAAGPTGLVDAAAPHLEPNTKVLVFVDQFEELFQDVQGKGEQARDDAKAFIRLLLAAAASDRAPVYVVITMRLEWLNECATYTGLAEAINEGIYLVPQMPRRQFQQSILGPIDTAAERTPAGTTPVAITSALVDRMLNDLDGRSDQLPLLQHVLMRMWYERKADSAVFDVSLYNEVGGVLESLSRHAEAIYQLKGRDREAAEVLFKAITQMSEGRKQRRPRVLSTIATESGIATTRLSNAVQAFGQMLVTRASATVGDPVIDLSHEALIRQWARLGMWVEQEDAARVVVEGLSRNAVTWKRDPKIHRGLLCRGSQLRDAEALKSRFGPGSIELEFLAASRWAERIDRSKSIGSLSSVLVLSLIVGAMYRLQTNRERSLVLSNAGAKLESDPALAKLMLAALRGGGPPADGVKVGVNIANAPVVEAELACRPSASQVTWSPDGAHIAALCGFSGALTVWRSTSQSMPIELTGHDGPITATMWSPDGTQIATASTDFTARVWTVATGQAVVLRGHDNQVKSLRWSPDGRRLVTVSADHTARIWSRDGATLVVLRGHTDVVNSADWSPDGSQVVTASSDGTARVWQADGRQVVELKGHRGSVLDAGWSADGKLLMTASSDGTTRIWDRPGHLELSIEVLGGITSAMWLNRDVATVSENDVRFWSSGQDTQGKGSRQRVETNPNYVLQHSKLVGIAPDPSGRRVVTISEDRTARVWFDDRRFVELRGHRGPVWAAAWNPDGSRIVTASGDGTLRIWRPEGSGEKVLRESDGFIDGAQWSPDETRVLTESGQAPARIWKLDGTSSLILRTTSATSIAKWSPDGTRIVTVSSGALDVWRPDGSSLASLRSGATSPHLRDVAWNPDGTRLVTTTFSGETLEIWNPGNDHEPVVLHGNWEPTVFTTSWSPDGTRIVTGSSDGSVRLWTLNGETQSLSEKHAGPVLSARWSPDGSHVLTTSDDKTARIWATKDGTPRATLVGHTRSVTDGAWSPDGKRVATTSADGTAAIWDLDGIRTAELQGHENAVVRVAWSPDGLRLATASTDWTIRIWDIRGVLEPIVLRGHQGEVTTVTWSRNGKRLLSTSNDGTARIWLVDWDDLTDAIASSTTRCLTAQEREQYLYQWSFFARRRAVQCDAALAAQKGSTK